MNPVCFIEARKPSSPQWWQYGRVVPTAVWDCANGTRYGMRDNVGALDMLADLPREKRGLRLDWFGEPELPHGHTEDQVAEIVDELRRLFPNEPKPLRLVFCDPEDPDQRPDVLTRQLAPLSDLADLSCGWDRCDAGRSPWGPYGGKVGTASCAAGYEALTTANVRRIMDVLRRNAPNVILHGPPVEREAFGPRVYDTAEVYSRIRQTLSYAALTLGLSAFVVAEYMVPDDLIEKYLACIDRTLADIARVTPEEAAAQ